ncbi:MAG: hypothetical protein WC455_13255 [Dehalococcoidia bacterium]|jgi:hypothetical protein
MPKSKRDNAWYFRFKTLVDAAKSKNALEVCECVFQMMDGAHMFGSERMAKSARESMLLALSDGVDEEEVAVCDNCGSDDVEVRVWQNLKTGRIDDGSCDRSDMWCNHCLGHESITWKHKEKEVKAP